MICAFNNYSNKSYTNTKEKHHLGLLWYGESNLHWRHFEDRDIFYCKGEVAQFLNSIGFNNIHFKIAPFQGFNTALKIYYNKIQIGFLGIPDKKLLKFYDIKDYYLGFHRLSINGLDSRSNQPFSKNGV